MIRSNESVAEGLRKNGGKKPRNPFKGGRSYRQFYDGYTIASENENIQSTVKRKPYLYIYTGEYHCFDMSDEDRIKRKLTCALMFAGAVFLFLSGALRFTDSNMAWYVTLFQAVEIPILVWHLICLIRLCRGVKMTSFQYRSAVITGTKTVKYATIVMAVETVMLLIFMFVHAGGVSPAEYQNLVSDLSCTAMLYILYRLEDSISYRTEKSDEKIPYGYKEMETISLEEENS